jgi:hypothetical protein
MKSLKKKANKALIPKFNLKNKSYLKKDKKKFNLELFPSYTLLNLFFKNQLLKKSREKNNLIKLLVVNI